jgi:hypothetical protein
MPDQPHDESDQELEGDVRDTMDGMASEAAPPPSAPPGVLRAAKRRVARNSAALVLALVLIAGGIAAGLQLTNRHSTSDPIGSTTGPPSVAPTSSTESPEPTPSPTGSEGTPTPSPTEAEPSPTETLPTSGGGTGTGPLPAMLFLDGVIWRYVNGTKGLAGIAVGSIPEPGAAQPPVATPFGIVVLGGTPDRGGNLWLIQPNGDRELLDSGVVGFGVSGNGSQVAYALEGDGQHSILVEHSLVTGESTARFPGLDTFARVIGYVGNQVVLDTGDGAAATVAMWEPSTDRIVSVDGFGSAVGTDPTSDLAVLNQGDGPCWWVVRIRSDGTGDPLQEGDCRPALSVSFEPGGATLAGVEVDPAFDSPGRRLIVAGTESELGGAVNLTGAFQAWWAEPSGPGPGNILVMSLFQRHRLSVIQCRVSENLCSEQPVWTTYAGERSNDWIVEERPAPGSG